MRAFEIARGVRVSKDPALMDERELRWALQDVAVFASKNLIEANTLRKLVGDVIKSGGE